MKGSTFMKVFLQRSPATAFAGLAFNHYSCFFVLSIYIDLLLSTGAIFAQEMNIEVVVVENGISPVSYTHLDVYKRQGLDKLCSSRRGQSILTV